MHGAPSQKSGDKILWRQEARCWLCQVLCSECKSAKRNGFCSPSNRNLKWQDNQHRRLSLENKASQVAQFTFKTTSRTRNELTRNRHTHELSMSDPFDFSSCLCSSCRFFFQLWCACRCLISCSNTSIFCTCSYLYLKVSLQIFNVGLCLHVIKLSTYLYLKLQPGMFLQLIHSLTMEVLFSHVYIITTLALFVTFRLLK